MESECDIDDADLVLARPRGKGVEVGGSCPGKFRDQRTTPAPRSAEISASDAPASRSTSAPCSPCAGARPAGKDAVSTSAGNERGRDRKSTRLNSSHGSIS